MIMVESYKRSIIKSVCWRIVATLTTVLIVYIFTHRVVLALEVGLFELIAKIVFYYFHERLWARIKWGKAKHPLEGLFINKKLKPEDIERIRTQLREMGYIE
jgi:adenylylsulfate kinase